MNRYEKIYSSGSYEAPDQDTKRKSGGKVGGIHIKKANEGKLHETTGVPEGKKIPLATLEKKKNSPDPATRKRANFAINARSWHH